MSNYIYSIIIPHINEGYLLNITLDSIYNKFKYDKYEIIIVDDGSDNIKDLDFVKIHPLQEKIHVFFEKDLGLSRAKNFGAEKSSGDFLIFLDAHMYFKDDFLTHLNEILRVNKKVDLLQPVVGSITDKSLEGTIYKIKDLFLNSAWVNLHDETYSTLIETPCVSGGATVVKKKVFEKLTGFNRNFIKWGCEDIEFSMRAWLCGYKCYFSSSLFVAHYFKESFENTIIKNEHVANNRIMFAYTCFQNTKRLTEVLNTIKVHYGEKLFNEIQESILKNTDFWLWLDSQKKKYKHDDNWYFKKFNVYYLEFNSENNETV